jgi:hypothetical protein
MAKRIDASNLFFNMGALTSWVRGVDRRFDYSLSSRLVGEDRERLVE